MAPGFWLGMGLGAFIDGIVLHQVLQWHHLLSNADGYSNTTIQDLEENTFADGVFHLSAWLFVAIGSVLAVRAWQQKRPAPRWQEYAGMLLVGWGVFNFVEGIVDHHVLAIHHVRDDLGGPLAWDVAFTVFGAALVVVGATLSRDRRPRPSGDHPRRTRSAPETAGDGRHPR